MVEEDLPERICLEAVTATREALVKAFMVRGWWKKKKEKEGGMKFFSDQ
jgi:hypothetical protein